MALLVVLVISSLVSLVLGTGQGYFNERMFTEQLQSAMTRTRQVLETSKHPTFIGEVSHTYQDKYLLAEFLLTTALSATANAMNTLGMSTRQQLEMAKWASNHTITMHFDAVEKCDFHRNMTREEDIGPVVRVEVESEKDGKTHINKRAVQNVTDYFYNYRVDYKLYACKGVGSEVGDCMTLKTAAVMDRLTVRNTPRPPRDSLLVRPSISCDITTFLQSFRQQRLPGDVVPNLHVALEPSFSIDRNSTKCFTPRRNPDVDAVLKQIDDIWRWAILVQSYTISGNIPSQSNDHPVSAAEVFVPILPIMMDCSDPEVVDEACVHNEEQSKSQSQSSTAVISPTSMNALLEEQVRSFHKKQAQLETVFGRDAVSSDGAPTPAAVNAVFRLSLLHIMDICRQTLQSINYIEHLMRQQLVSAIGKEVTPMDIAAYMVYHDDKIFKPLHKPQPFSYAVRRSSQHSPEGMVGVEAVYRPSQSGNDQASFNILNNAPIYTATQLRKLDTQPAESNASSVSKQSPVLMKFSIDASTKISLSGEVMVHSYLQPRFTGELVSVPDLFLTAQARQFSSFMVLVGRISSADTFEPSSAMIVKNKDQLRIPLEMAVIPTEKEFRDAIESLSPEQQRFAKSFRGMQMQHTLFGICVIQIKPQLEKVLNLPADSLTKEIALTEDLMELFIDYQIPTDLLSHSPATGGRGAGGGGVEAQKGLVADSGASDAIAAVKANVAAIQVLL
jgi:hypothetical protein